MAELIKALTDWRSDKAALQDVPLYFILSKETIRDIAWKKPMTIDELLDIRGIGAKKANEYGKDIISIVKRYGASNRNQKKTSAEITYDYFRSGMDIDEIAEERELKRSTVLSHLLTYVESGDISPLELVDEDTARRILDCLPYLPEGYNSTDVFNELNEEVSYEDIRICLRNLDAIMYSI